LEDIEGWPTELIDRLIEIVDVGETTGGDWHELGYLIAMMLGGKRLSRVDPDTGRDYPPGCNGAKRRETAEVVSRDAYFDRIRDTLAELVVSGMDPVFLIRALRDEVRR
jgi:hypothetical protein